MKYYNKNNKNNKNRNCSDNFTKNECNFNSRDISNNHILPTIMEDSLKMHNCSLLDNRSTIFSTKKFNCYDDIILKTHTKGIKNKDSNYIMKSLDDSSINTNNINNINNIKTENTIQRFISNLDNKSIKSITPFDTHTNTPLNSVQKKTLHHSNNINKSKRCDNNANTTDTFNTNNLHSNTKLPLDLQLILNDAELDFYKNYYSLLSEYDNLLKNYPNLLDSPTNKPSTLLDNNINNGSNKNSLDYNNNHLEQHIEKELVSIKTEINSLSDLINLCDEYPLADNIEYNINMQTIHKIKPYLQELDNMIGMKSIKENIVDQILYFVQNLHCVSPTDSDYMHTVIYGPPGTGKTEVAKIMGKIFSNIGVLQNNKFKKVTRDDLVAGFLGQTAIKTKEMIKESLGGVLFIDEAYALGNSEKHDSFSKECIDTLCESLSNHKKDFMCIIAGYEKEIRDCFFSYNDGLESRFIWKFKIDEYSAEELKMIFAKKIKDSGWSIKDPLEVEWFQKNLEAFKYYGRDIETLFSKVKIAHSRRVFCLSKEDKTYITKHDLEKGFQMYVNNEELEKRKQKKEQERMLHYSLYS